MLEGSFSFVSELKTNQFTTFTEEHITPEVWRNSPLMQNCGDCIFAACWFKLLYLFICCRVIFVCQWIVPTVIYHFVLG